MTDYYKKSDFEIITENCFDSKLLILQAYNTLKICR